MEEFVYLTPRVSRGACFGSKPSALGADHGRLDGDRPLVTYALQNSATTISVNRPAKRNAIHNKMLGTWHSAMERTALEARVMVIHNHGQNFLVGLGLALVAAEQVGLVQRCVPPGEALPPATKLAGVASLMLLGMWQALPCIQDKGEDGFFLEGRAAALAQAVPEAAARLAGFMMKRGPASREAE